MGKNSITAVLLTLLAATCLLASCGSPPIREEVDVQPKNYLSVNQFVREQRKEFFEEGVITPDFLPDRIDLEQTVSYLYWYACAAMSDPNYAISVTIHIPSDEALLDEIRRINDLAEFERIEYDEYIVFGVKGLLGKINSFFEPPVRDGSRYCMEYAIISMKNNTITYSELCIWENQIINEEIKKQLDLIDQANE